MFLCIDYFASRFKKIKVSVDLRTFTGTNSTCARLLLSDFTSCSLYSSSLSIKQKTKTSFSFFSPLQPFFFAFAVPNFVKTKIVFRSYLFTSDTNSTYALTTAHKIMKNRFQKMIFGIYATVITFLLWKLILRFFRKF